MPRSFRPFLAATLLTAICHAWASPIFKPVPPAEPPNIWLAAARGDVAVMEQLLAAGEAVDEADAQGLPPLMHALRHRQWAAARTLLDRGANPSHIARNGFAPLAYAFWAGQPTDGEQAYDGRWLRLLLDRGASMHTAASLQQPLLAVVAQAYPPLPDALRIVLPYGPPINQRFGAACETALMSAVRSDTKHAKDGMEVVRLLLEAGASPNLTSITNHNVGTDRSHPTPLLRTTQAFAYDELWDAGQREQQLVAMLDLLFEHGADPRVGGIGGRQEDHQSLGCSELAAGGPGLSASASPAWSDFSGSKGNPALTEALGNTVAFRTAFDRIVSASAPTAWGEVGYPALNAALSSYASVLDMLQTIDSGRFPHPDDKRRAEQLQARKADLEHAMRTLLSLGVPSNPSHVMRPPGSDWNELWIARRVPEQDGVEHLPLFEHRMPDAIYQAFLQGGAQAALRPGGLNSKRDALLTHLIRNNAASKLVLLREHLGLLALVPTWCHRSVVDIALALGEQPDSAQARLKTPSGRAAKGILLDLLSQPTCYSRNPNTAVKPTLRELLSRLGDADINQAYAQRAQPTAATKAPPRLRPAYGQKKG